MMGRTTGEYNWGEENSGNKSTFASKQQPWTFGLGSDTPMNTWATTSSSPFQNLQPSQTQWLQSADPGQHQEHRSVHSRQHGNNSAEWSMPVPCGMTGIEQSSQRRDAFQHHHQRQALWGSAMPFGTAPLDAGGLSNDFEDLLLPPPAKESPAKMSPRPHEYDQDSKIVSALCEYLRGKDWVEITTPRQINEACAAIVRHSGVSLQKLNKKLKKGSWRDKLTNFVLLYPSMFSLNITENTFFVRLRVDAPYTCEPPAKPPQNPVVGSSACGSSVEEQVVELVRALLIHLKNADGKEWVDITNMPKAAHMIQQKKPVVGVSLRWGNRHVGPEEWQRLMAEIRTKHGKLANFLAKYSDTFEIRSRPGGKDIRLTPDAGLTLAASSESQHSGDDASRGHTEEWRSVDGLSPSSSSWSLGEKVCDNCGKPGHLSSQCTSSVQCHCCGASDHTKKDCPRRSDKCNICGKVGHLAAKCRDASNPVEGQACFVLLESRLSVPSWPADWRAWIRATGGGGQARVRSVYSSAEAAIAAARTLYSFQIRSGEGWEHLPGSCVGSDRAGEFELESDGTRAWVARKKPIVSGQCYECVILTVQPSTLDAAAP